jgi:predicted Zn finger-like uncharacterized protein
MLMADRKRVDIPNKMRCVKRLAGQGIQCPSCSCRDFRVVDSRGVGVSRGRVRACRHCGTVIATREDIVQVIELHETDSGSV